LTDAARPKIRATDMGVGETGAICPGSHLAREPRWGPATEIF